MFNPFGDFEVAGYLRNELRLKDSQQIKLQEHLFFTANLQEAAGYLAGCEMVTYEDFCVVHRILFSGFYPWAGLDRQSLGVARNVSKGERVDFVYQRSHDVPLSMDYDSAIAPTILRSVQVRSWGCLHGVTVS